MKKISLNSILSLLIGAIVFVVCLTLNKLGIDISLQSMLAYFLSTCFLSFILLQPYFLGKIKHLLNDIDWAETTISYYKSIPHLYKKSFWLSFLFINICYLFHTINFMWGAYDWEAIRFDVNHSPYDNYGNFSAFALQNLLFDGKILPIINNLWSFMGLSFAGILTANYLKAPKTVASYTIITLFFALSPYTLGWLYHTQNTLGNLTLPAFILTAIILSHKATNSLNHSFAYNLCSIGLFILSLGTYLGSINFILTILTGKILITVITENQTIKEAASRQLQAFANLTASVLIYIFIIMLMKLNTSSYIFVNFTPDLAHIKLLFSSIFTQFITTYPFIDCSLKVFYLTIVLTGIFALILKAPSANTALKCLYLLPLMLLCSKISILFTAHINQSTNILDDFYGLNALYTIVLVLLLKLDSTYLKRFIYALSCLIIFMCFVRVSYALKVWKFGFDAETKLAERIITRLEKMENFNIDRQYKLLQIGSIPMRSRYYLAKENELKNEELLSLPYYQEETSSKAYNFFYQTDFLSQNTSLKLASRDDMIKDFILNSARPWPAKESILITGEHIVFILDEKSLYEAQQYLLKN